MSDKYLSEEEEKALFMKGFHSAFAEKDAGVLKDAIDGFKDLGVGAWKAFIGTPGLLKDIGVYGTLSGALAGAGYNIVKDNLTSRDPQEKFQAKVEKMILDKKREREDAQWMTRVRDMRAELIRDWKKMSPEEYSTKYNALVDALNERMA